jgi:hypothetical protein
MQDEEQYDTREADAPMVTITAVTSEEEVQVRADGDRPQGSGRFETLLTETSHDTAHQNEGKGYR